MSAEIENQSLFARLLASFGEPAMEVTQIVKGIAKTGSLTWYYSLRGRKRWDAIFEQLHDIGNRSVVFIAFTLGFLGMILICQGHFIMFGKHGYKHTEREKKKSLDIRKQVEDLLKGK